MRLATLVEDGALVPAVVRESGVLSLAGIRDEFPSVRAIAAAGPAALARIGKWADAQPAADRPIADVVLGPAVPDPGAIYAIGLNYGTPPPAEAPPDRPLVYAKLPTAVAGHRETLAWDRSVTPNVDAESELGVVIGAEARNVSAAQATAHIFGYTCVNDVSSRDPWLDGDQWLLGKSMPGFCPIGPWVVTADELDPGNLAIGCTINGHAIQHGTTAGMRFGICELIAFLSRHVVLRPGDVIATGTPARLPAPLAPDQHLEPGDEVTVWIEGIGELTTTIA